MSQKTLVIIGGGAAGFFCAVNAARIHDNLQVILLEKTGKLLSKVRVSGGGRCNVTHACFDISEMSAKYPRGQHFVKKAFHQFFTTDTIQWFEERGVKLKKEADGRMFPVSDSSQSILDCLLTEAARYNVKILMHADVKTIESKESQFLFELTDSRKLSSDYCCIASGGYPKLSMFSWLTDLGHSIAAPVPSLFTFNMPKHPLNQLMGVSVENARVKIMGTKLEQEGPLLITHWGFSGPVVLKLSAWGAQDLAEKNYEFVVLVNWLSEYNAQQLIEQIQSMRITVPAHRVGAKNSFNLPQRLWEFLTNEAGIAPTTRWADLRSKEANKLARLLCSSEFVIKGKTTFKEEFVTAGGIKLNEIDHNTMMSKKIQNLFFAGEVLDVDGITGGFNFQHAWTSGWIAARSIGG